MDTDNIKAAIIRSGLKLPEVAQRSGIPLETVRNIYYGRVNDIKASTLIGLARCLQTSADYLLGLSEPNVEGRILRYYHQSSEHGKKVIEMLAEYEASFNQNRTKSDPHLIPILVPCGENLDWIRLNTCELSRVETSNPKAYLGFVISTNHFAPRFYDGDVVLLEDRFPDNSEFAVFSDEHNYAYFMQYFREGKSKFVLKCLNGRIDDIHLDRNSKVKCMGTFIDVI